MIDDRRVLQVINLLTTEIMLTADDIISDKRNGVAYGQYMIWSHDAVAPRLQQPGGGTLCCSCPGVRNCLVVRGTMAIMGLGLSRSAGTG